MQIMLWLRYLVCVRVCVCVYEFNCFVCLPKINTCLACATRWKPLPVERLARHPHRFLTAEPREELVGMRSSFAVGARNARVSAATAATTITARCHSEFVS